MFCVIHGNFDSLSIRSLKCSLLTVYKLTGEVILSNVIPSLDSILGSSTSPKSALNEQDTCINTDRSLNNKSYVSVYFLVCVLITSSLFFNSTILLLYSVLDKCFLVTLKFLNLDNVSP